MDNGSISRIGHHLRVAAFPSQIFLHQAKVDIIREVYEVRRFLYCKIWEGMETGRPSLVGIKEMQS
jgi:hypothetical protein